MERANLVEIPASEEIFYLVTISIKGILKISNLTPWCIPMHILSWTDCVRSSAGKISYIDIFSSSNLQK